MSQELGPWGGEALSLFQKWTSAASDILYLSCYRPLFKVFYLDKEVCIMVSREECDLMYKSIGLPRFSPSYTRAEVQSMMGDSLSVSQAQHIMRCVTLAETCDVDEYFELSEYFTTEEAVESIMDPHKSFSVYLYHPNGTNTQYPMSLSPIRPYGYVYNKYMYHYKAVPLDCIRQDRAYRQKMLASINNLPEETIKSIIDYGQGYVLRPREAIDPWEWYTTEPLEWYTILPKQTWTKNLMDRVWSVLLS
jgi:hypothetical protein